MFAFVVIAGESLLLWSESEEVHSYRHVTQFNAQHKPIAEYLSKGDVRVIIGTAHFQDCITGERVTLSGNFSVRDADATVYADPSPCK